RESLCRIRCRCLRLAIGWQLVTAVSATRNNPPSNICLKKINTLVSPPALPSSSPHSALPFCPSCEVYTLAADLVNHTAWPHDRSLTQLHSFQDHATTSYFS
ncbi:unnamed protein product, partial [Ectocarpus sp. 12 AP-2014]